MAVLGFPAIFVANNQAISTFFTLKIGSILGGVKDVINAIASSHHGSFR